MINDFTAALDASGPWQIVADWTLAVNTASGKVEFQAALNMVRSENPSRQSHTHHVAMTDGQVTPIAGGYRISGTAAITSNGALAGFTGLAPRDRDYRGQCAELFQRESGVRRIGGRALRRSAARWRRQFSAVAALRPG